VAVAPTHIAVGVAEAVTVGVGVTINVTVAVEVQPMPLAPVKVYVVVEPGVTVTLAPVSAPGFQVYEVAPLPVKVAELPLQIAVGELAALTVGIGFTVSITVLVAEQPAVVPVTE
jgi:hypothetical protein